MRPGDPCPACAGTGLSASRRFHCWRCYGSGKIQEKRYYWAHREEGAPAELEGDPAEVTARATLGVEQGERICPRCQGSCVSECRTRHCSACLGSGVDRPRTSGWQ
jgi:DnaJ-class molecular chaperone